MAGGLTEGREVAAVPPAMPEPIASAVAGYRWARDTVGESGAAVYRLHASDRPTLFLKHGTGDVAAAVADEAARLAWLAAHLPVPEVVGFVAGRDAWLLTAALPGRTAYQRLAEEPESRVATVDALTDLLRRLHALPVGRCPFDSGHELRLAHARQRLIAGEVDADDFGAEHAGWSPEQVWEEMVGLLPLAADPVVTHGDYSLDNILLGDGGTCGCIDVGLAGVADRYQDIAILWHSLAEFGAEWQQRFLHGYGIAEPDMARLRFHLCLDEFF